MQNKAFPAVAADITGLALFLAVIVPFLGPFISNPTVRGGSLIFFVFVLAGLALNRLKRLESNNEFSAPWLKAIDFSNNQSALITLGVSLIIVFVLMQVNLNDLWGDTVDLFENTGEVHEGEMTLYITFGPIFIWFMAGAFYLAGYVLKTEKVIEKESAAYGWTEFFGLLIVNLLLGMFALFISGWLSRTVPTLGPAIAFIITWLGLELLFIPVRLRHTFRNPQLFSMLSFLLLIFLIAYFTL